jgi:hypothetical protein
VVEHQANKFSVDRPPCDGLSRTSQNVDFHRSRNLPRKSPTSGDHDFIVPLRAAFEVHAPSRSNALAENLNSNIGIAQNTIREIAFNGNI